MAYKISSVYNHARCGWCFFTSYCTITHRHAGLYCSGWAKTGPVQGVALHTMPYAFETAEAIIEDYKQGTIYTCTCACTYVRE